MKPTNIPNLKNQTPEPKNLRILRISTTLMTIVMLVGFVVIVCLLSIAINKTISNNPILDFNKKFDLQQNEFLTAVTYSKKYTILLIKNDKNIEILRIMLNKTGKVVSNTLLSELSDTDSKN